MCEWLPWSGHEDERLRPHCHQCPLASPLPSRSGEDYLGCRTTSGFGGGGVGMETTPSKSRNSLPHLVKSLLSLELVAPWGKLKIELVTGPGHFSQVNKGRIQEHCRVRAEGNMGRRQRAGSCRLCLEPLPQQDSTPLKRLAQGLSRT